MSSLGFGSFANPYGGRYPGTGPSGYGRVVSPTPTAYQVPGTNRTVYSSRALGIQMALDFSHAAAFEIGRG